MQLPWYKTHTSRQGNHGSGAKLLPYNSNNGNLLENLSSATGFLPAVRLRQMAIYQRLARCARSLAAATGQRAAAPAADAPGAARGSGRRARRQQR